MKKIYLILLILTGYFSLNTANAQTCAPDPLAVAQGPGIYPDSATNFVSGTVGVAYNQNITVVVPADTQLLPSPFPATPFDWRAALISSTRPGFTIAVISFMSESYSYYRLNSYADSAWMAVSTPSISTSR